MSHLFNSAYTEVTFCQAVIAQLDSGRVDDAKQMLRTAGIGLLSTQLRFFLESGSSRFSFLSSASGSEVFSVWGGGSVGIGTANNAPNARLDVRGDIRLGNTGQYYAPGAFENLKMIRGVVTAAGGIIVGTGFTVTKGAVGLYTINFTNSFNGAPAITATAESQGGIARTAMTDGVTQTAATIRIMTVSSAPTSTDAPFHFIAVGPR